MMSARLSAYAAARRTWTSFHGGTSVFMLNTARVSVSEFSIVAPELEANVAVSRT